MAKYPGPPPAHHFNPVPQHQMVPVPQPPLVVHPPGGGCNPIAPGAKTPCVDVNPVPTVGISEKALTFDVAENLVMVIDQREGFIPAILGIGYSVDAPGALAIAPHPVRIDLVAVQDPTLPFTSLRRYQLLNDEVRYFTILSDGERSILDPILGGGG